MTIPAPTWFAAAVGLIGLHVVDDSFLQPQPGTSGTDHLISGLVPLAILAAAIWAYPRLRAGARGTLALVLGALGAGGSVEALRYWSQVGLSGDDYTGLISLVAGLGLIGLGAVTLWRSRRLDDRRAWRYPRRGLLTIAGLLVTASVIFPVILAYGVTHIARSETNVADLGRPHEDVTLRTADGLDLPGWYIPSRNGAAVIVFPGRGSAQRQARVLSRHGYGVLLYDRRGEGDAEGDPEGFGWSFAHDIRAGVEFLKRRSDVRSGAIGGLGLSVGGEMMLQAAAEDEDIAAVVSEGAGSRTLSEELADLDGAERYLGAAMLSVKTLAVAVFSDHAPPPNLATLIPRIAPRPVFLINAAHHEVDRKSPEYFAAAGAPKQRWEVPMGGHTGGITAMPAEYERRVVSFFDRALLP